jgi:hypothetical protein
LRTCSTPEGRRREPDSLISPACSRILCPLRVNRLLSLLTLLVATAHAGVSSSALLGYRGEPGIESKMLIAAKAELVPVQYLKLAAGLSFNLFQNNGLDAAGLGISAVLFRPVGLALRVAAQHQQWNDWQAGENRALATIEAGPVLGIEAGFGLARRVPLFGEGYSSPFTWKSDAAEWNYVYRLTWKFLQKEDWWLKAGLSSYDLLSVHNPQQFPLCLSGSYALKDNLDFVADIGTAIVGYSGGLVSFHELTLNAGVKYAI